MDVLVACQSESPLRTPAGPGCRFDDPILRSFLDPTVSKGEWVHPSVQGLHRLSEDAALTPRVTGASEAWATPGATTARGEEGILGEKREGETPSPSRERVRSWFAPCSPSVRLTPPPARDLQRRRGLRNWHRCLLCLCPFLPSPPSPPSPPSSPPPPPVPPSVPRRPFPRGSRRSRTPTMEASHVR